MNREVDLVAYLPSFMAKYQEINATLQAENPEFDLLWKEADRVWHNQFIETADEYGIARFEKLLGIYPEALDTIESRRSRVQSKWFTELPYSMKMLKCKLEMLCGTNNFELLADFEKGYTLTVRTNLEMYGQIEEVENLLKQMVPVNVIIHLQNEIQGHTKGTVFSGGCVICMDTNMISNDFSEAYQVESDMVFGGGLVHTEDRVILD